MTKPPPDEDLTRIPGLYRRWELAEILTPERLYRIEDAGHHADGTPLVAVYIDGRDPLTFVPLDNDIARPRR